MYVRVLPREQERDEGLGTGGAIEEVSGGGDQECLGDGQDLLLPTVGAKEAEEPGKGREKEA